jgi:hypothetical protein
MLTIKGRVKDGVVYPSEPVAGYDQEEVLITFLNEQIRPSTPDSVPSAAQDEAPTDWDALDRIIDAHQMKTGISDLAHQHDHYIHGKPKRQ